MTLLRFAIATQRAIINLAVDLLLGPAEDVEQTTAGVRPVAPIGWEWRADNLLHRVA